MASRRKHSPLQTLTQPITTLTACGLESSPSTGSWLILVSAGRIRFYTYLIAQTASWQKEGAITVRGGKKGDGGRVFEPWMMSFLKRHTDRQRYNGQIWLSDCSLQLVPDSGKGGWKREAQREEWGIDSGDKRRAKNEFRLQTGGEKRGNQGLLIRCWWKEREIGKGSDKATDKHAGRLSESQLPHSL